MQITVSIVEDNRIYRNSLVQLIGSTEDLALATAYSNAEEAMALLQDNPDIVIIDIQLPGANGIELIKKLKPHNEKIQYLVCSSHSDDDNLFNALASGASGYILKDCTAGEIAGAIRAVYHGGSPMNATIARRVIASFQKKTRHPDFSLTAREREILELTAQGLMYKEIAEELFVSLETVKKHLRHIYKKMHVQNKIEAINKFKNH